MKPQTFGRNQQSDLRNRTCETIAFVDEVSAAWLARAEIEARSIQALQTFGTNPQHGLGAVKFTAFNDPPICIICKKQMTVSEYWFYWSINNSWGCAKCFPQI
jgi:hypothetical protein